MNKTTIRKVRAMGWKSICKVMDYELSSYKSCRKELEKHGLLRHNGNRPFILICEVEAFYRGK